VFAPAVSQGVIGICARAGDAATLRWLAPLEDRDARLAASAERALLRRIEGGCQVPLGALATVADRTLRLQASVCALDGSHCLSAQGESAASVADAVALGERLAEELLARGAGELIARERGRLAQAAP
jgi:hydroxymethylbilane synthase